MNRSILQACPVPILFVILFSSCGMRNDRSDMQRCSADINAFQTAIMQYKMNNEYKNPDTNQGLKVLTLYLDVKEIPMDPWGHAYVYICPGSYSGTEYDLYSIGKNGIDEKGSGDDITAWGEAPSDYYINHFDFIYKIAFGILIGLVVLLTVSITLYAKTRRKIYMVLIIMIWLAILIILFLGSYFT
jgi:general secretion pathway protein G